MPAAKLAPAKSLAAVVAFANSPAYHPPSTMPWLDTSLWTETASISPQGAAARKARRAEYEISGKFGFENAIVQMLSRSSALRGKLVGHAVTLIKAVGSEKSLQAILAKVNPKILAENALAVSGLHQFIGAYLVQVDGDTRELMAWMEPIFEPVLRVAASACPDPTQSCKKSKVGSESNRKIRIAGAHRFLLNTWDIQTAAEAKCSSPISPDSQATSEDGAEDAGVDAVPLTVPEGSPMKFADSPDLPNDCESMFSGDLHGFFPSPVNRSRPGALDPTIWRRSALVNGDRMLGSMFMGEETPQHYSLDTPMPGISPPSPKTGSVAGINGFQSPAGTDALNDFSDGGFGSEFLQTPFKYDESKGRRLMRADSENSPTGSLSTVSATKGRSPFGPVNGWSPGFQL
ncbi:hypothetical protein C8R46DRAFT_1187227 [Mycena filopes]|nr:hypothetical protein C8R46DRAFT_1187227 [Mycena filopes]